ncbi:MAG: hypothetical protein LBT31_02550 [Synergistaceae bacterium]|jgi:hypothetical protein|nr:hypothetical protein [Synergistaceae bacterium]
MTKSAPDIVRKILADSAVIAPVGRNGRFSVGLSGQRRKITVTDVPEDSVVIKIGGSFPRCGNFLSGEWARWRADYVLIGAANGKKIVVFIETGAASQCKKDTERLMHGAVCAIEYCAALAREFISAEGLVDGAKRYFVKMKPRGPVRKRFSYTARFASNDSPEMVRVIEGDSFPFSYLVRGR